MPLAGGQQLKYIHLHPIQAPRLSSGRQLLAILALACSLLFAASQCSLETKQLRGPKNLAHASDVHHQSDEFVTINSAD